MTQYSKELFDLFKNAGLPCARNNEISFMQTDFTNALSYLHKTSEYQHIHSSDVIGAVKNYIQVLQNPDCYVSSKMNLFQLVKSKNFYNYLPANFDESNFLNFNADGKKKEKKKLNLKLYTTGTVLIAERNAYISILILASTSAMLVSLCLILSRGQMNERVSLV